MDYTIFRERFKALVDSRGYSINALSDELNMTAATISRYLSGNRSPDLAYVVRLAEFFGVSVDWILGLNDDRFTVLSNEVQEIVDLYSLASEDDRRIINVVLNKYRPKG